MLNYSRPLIRRGRCRLVINLVVKLGLDRLFVFRLIDPEWLEKPSRRVRACLGHDGDFLAHQLYEHARLRLQQLRLASTLEQHPEQEM